MRAYRKQSSPVRLTGSIYRQRESERCFAGKYTAKADSRTVYSSNCKAFYCRNQYETGFSRKSSKGIPFSPTMMIREGLKNSANIFSPENLSGIRPLFTSMATKLLPDFNIKSTSRLFSRQ